MYSKQEGALAAMFYTQSHIIESNITVGNRSFCKVKVSDCILCTQFSLPILVDASL